MTTNLATLIITLAIVMTSIVSAEARHQNRSAGMIVEGGSGALVRQTISRDGGINTGFVFDTTLGVLTENRWAKDHAVVIGQSHLVPPAGHVYYCNWDNRHNRWHHQKHRRHLRRWYQERHHFRR